MIKVALNMFLALAVVLGLMWLLAKMARRPLGARGAGAMSVIARQPLTRAASVAVVRVGAQAYVLGVTDQNVTLLASLDSDEAAAMNPPHEVREQIPLSPGGLLAGSALSPSTWRRAMTAVRGGRKA